MTELSNFIGADPWICVLTRATDDYVRKLAEFLK